MTTISSRLFSATGRPLRLAVATMALAIGSAAALTAHAQPHGRGPGSDHGPGLAMEGRGGPFGLQIHQLMRDAKVTPEQRTQIRAIVDAARTDLRATREAGRTLREQSVSIFTQATVDARAAETLRQQMLANHDQASKRMLQAMLDVSRVLTPEQRTQMAERLKSKRAMMERHRAERQSLDRPAR